VPEQVTRIGCGAVVGLVVGVCLSIGVAGFLSSRFTFSAKWRVGAIVLTSVVTCAYLVWRFGNRFFHSIPEWFQGLW